ncbi:PAS domain S-box protein, partial [bacterium]|nr:PAS domain S-box protein [bacterium]
LQGIINIEKNNKINKRIVNFNITDLKGAIFNSLQTGKSFLIKDTDLHPIDEIDEKKLFPGSTMSSYVCVPLIKFSGKTSYSDPNLCILRKENDRKVNYDGFNPYLTDNRCLSCPHLPLLGALIVTDGYRATPLTNIDQVTVETVGSLVSSNIENWLLYQELRQTETFMEKVFEGMSLGLFVTDLDGKINFANRSAKSMVQMEASVLEETTISDLIIDTDIDRDESLLFNTLYRDDTIILHEGYLKRADGYHIPIRINTSQFLGENNEIQGTIVLFVDLSDIKEMEEEIRHLDRLAVLGRFTSAIAHEIRNPLTGIGAGVQYLKRSSIFSDDQNNSVDSILSEVNRLDRIISDLFKVAKPRDILYQQVDISELIERSYNSVKAIFTEKGVEFTEVIDDNVIPVEVDPDQIIQVLINLIKNAVEATEKGGKVIVKGKCYDEKITDEKIKEKEKIIRIEIIDNGMGIDDDSIEKVFEPFFSKKIKGTGLGLFISHSIIQHHHGTIDVYSREGEGTTFKINLPVNKHGR